MCYTTKKNYFWIFIFQKVALSVITAESLELLICDITFSIFSAMFSSVYLISPVWWAEKNTGLGIVTI